MGKAFKMLCKRAFMLLIVLSIVFFIMIIPGIIAYMGEAISYVDFVSTIKICFMYSRIAACLSIYVALIWLAYMWIKDNW